MDDDDPSDDLIEDGTGFSLPAELDTPCLLLDGDTLMENIVTMQSALDARGVALRPHAKTHKCVQIAHLQLEAGAAGITVGTIGEAEVFADGGIQDLFVAYPLWASEPKSRRLAELVGRATITVGIDSAAGAGALGRVDVGTSGSLRAMVEVDSGGARSGCRLDDVATVAEAGLGAGLHVVGAFTHGGHSYGGPGDPPDAADDEVRSLLAAADHLRSVGIQDPVLSAGSTPTALLSARNGITEERPGTYVFGDRQQAALGSVGRPALLVAATVVSVAADRLVLDSGAKSLAQDRAPWMDGYGSIVGFPGLEIAALSDYHAVVPLPEGTRAPRLGETVAVIPNHACPVVNLFDGMTVIRDGRVAEEWPVDARGRSS